MNRGVNVRGQLNVHLLELRQPCIIHTPLRVVRGETWEDKISTICQQLGNDFGQIYKLKSHYLLGELLAEKGWNTLARQEVRKHMNLYRYREAWMVSLRVFQLYQARGGQPP